MNQPTVYLNTLFSIKKTMANKDSYNQDLIWLQCYKNIALNGWETSNLPYLLALIHPDFYFKQGISLVGNLSWKRTADFGTGITNTSKCMAKHYVGDECIFNSIPEIRGKCHADHFWPNSLGGPSIIDNRLILCKYHNGMKGNDVYNYQWNSFPTWIKSYLEQLYRLKA